ncbi:hypothetical protein H0H93_016944 [Arthromyces matolae]|nr:hypothetical protein H0H93_016944 [Arthromyces matolae]
MHPRIGNPSFASYPWLSNDMMNAETLSSILPPDSPFMVLAKKLDECEQLEYWRGRSDAHGVFTAWMRNELASGLADTDCHRVMCGVLWSYALLDIVATTNITRQTSDRTAVLSAYGTMNPDLTLNDLRGWAKKVQQIIGCDFLNDQTLLPRPRGRTDPALYLLGEISRYEARRQCSTMISNLLSAAFHGHYHVPKHIEDCVTMPNADESHNSSGDERDRTRTEEEHQRTLKHVRTVLVPDGDAEKMQKALAVGVTCSPIVLASERSYKKCPNDKEMIANWQEIRSVEKPQDIVTAERFVWECIFELADKLDIATCLKTLLTKVNTFASASPVSWIVRSETALVPTRRQKNLSRTPSSTDGGQGLDLHSTHSRLTHGLEEGRQRTNLNTNHETHLDFFTASDIERRSNNGVDGDGGLDERWFGLIGPSHFSQLSPFSSVNSIEQWNCTGSLPLSRAPSLSSHDLECSDEAWDWDAEALDGQAVASGTTTSCSEDGSTGGTGKNIFRISMLTKNADIAEGNILTNTNFAPYNLTTGSAVGVVSPLPYNWDLQCGLDHGWDGDTTGFTDPDLFLGTLPNAPSDAPDETGKGRGKRRGKPPGPVTAKTRKKMRTLRLSDEEALKVALARKQFRVEHVVTIKSELDHHSQLQFWEGVVQRSHQNHQHMRGQGCITVTTDVEMTARDAKSCQMMLRNSNVVIQHKPRDDMAFTMDSLRKLGSLEAWIDIEDQSVQDEDRRRTRGTPVDLLRNSEECNPKPLRGGRIPSMHDSFQGNSFMLDWFTSENHAWEEVKGMEFCGRRESFPLSELRWGQCCTAGILQSWRVEEHGFATMLSVDVGAVVMFLLHAKPGAGHISVDVDDVNHDGVNWNLYSVEAVLLVPGVTMYVFRFVRRSKQALMNRSNSAMRPMQVHCYAMMENTIWRGALFYATSTLALSIEGMMCDFTSTGPSPNHSTTSALLTHMLTLFHRNLTLPLPRGVPERAMAHVPDVTVWEELLNLITLCSYFELASPFDEWTYGSTTELHDWKRAVHNRRLARDLMGWVFENHKFTSSTGGTLCGAKARDEIYYETIAKTAQSAIYRNECRSHAGQGRNEYRHFVKAAFEDCMRNSPIWPSYKSLGTPSKDFTVMKEKYTVERMDR